MVNRLIKVGTRTDRARALTYAELTLAGRWLVAAGFHPEDYVRVEVGEPGVLTLRRCPRRGAEAVAAAK